MPPVQVNGCQGNSADRVIGEEHLIAQLLKEDNSADRVIGEEYLIGQLLKEDNIADRVVGDLRREDVLNLACVSRRVREGVLFVPPLPPPDHAKK